MNDLSLLRQESEKGSDLFQHLLDLVKQEAALRGLAVHVVEASEPLPPGVSDMQVGDLSISVISQRAFWKGKMVKTLTYTEFSILKLLAGAAGRDVSYRQIYNLVRPAGFAAGHGEEGYKANVRTFIKRIRQKFCEIDPDFNRIEAYPRFGYRWFVEEVAPGQRLETAG